MNIIDILRKNILYFFVSLPFVIIAYEVLMTLTVLNSGYMVLLLGQVVAVPLGLFIFNLLNIVLY